MAKVDAHLYLPPMGIAAAAAPGASPSPASPASYSLDLLRGCSFLLGCGAVLPELEALLMQLQVGAAAQARVLLPYEGCDVLRSFTPQPALLALHLLDISQPKGGRPPACRLLPCVPSHGCHVLPLFLSLPSVTVPTYDQLLPRHRKGGHLSHVLCTQCRCSARALLVLLCGGLPALHLLGACQAKVSEASWQSDQRPATPNPAPCC
ncbi:hypothetical protein COO60DRAFT_38503 [Scenedesmus sp. NREL 46B-D3]|nr:hypothetical protein COO60DRAFT_38503 [Scenedesmus sp. NREL 46B-D3]